MHLYKTSVTTQTTVNSEIYANIYSDPPPPPKNKNKKRMKKEQPVRFGP